MMRFQVGGEEFLATDVAYVDRLVLQPGESGGLGQLRLEVRLQHRRRGQPWPVPDGPLSRAVLTFDGVSSLKLGPVTQFPFQIVGFDVIDNPDANTEYGRYEVVDYESGLLSCSCQRVTVADV
jgi:hypothetical protein